MPASKPKLYLETTIPSYLTARQSRNPLTGAHQQVTRDWWEQRRSHYALCVSQVVLDEAGDGDGEFARKRLNLLAEASLLDTSADVIALADELVRARVVPTAAARDALHIAVSAVHSVPFLLTWNCRHIANGHVLPRIREVCRDAGWSCPTIVTPLEMIHTQDDEPLD